MIAVDELQRRAAERAMNDPEFRRQLLADPKAVLNREFGISIPDDVEIIVHVSDPRTVHVVLAPVLNEEQLNAVYPGRCSDGS